MKKITTSAGLYGPFLFVEVMQDRYRCDGADLPFTVVGQGTVEDAAPEDFPATNFPALPVVPASITPRQARLALLDAGMLTSVDAALASLPEPQKTSAQIEWEYATSVERNSPLVESLGSALGLTSTQIDGLFIQASKL